MYTEEYEKKGFPIRDFILKAVLVVLFVFLLVWMLPKFMAPAISNNSTKQCASSTCDTTGISALTSQIFANNIEKMKDAAISYYTDERLPKNIGDSETMTLSDMIGKKIIVPLVDKNNKAVDVEKSYVKISKLDDEYILKINLKDSEKEDYILVHLGCYNYCDSYLCEKRPSSTPSTRPTTSSKPSPTVPVTRPSSDPEPTPSSDPSTCPSCPVCPTCPSTKPSCSPSTKPSKSPSTKPSKSPSTRPSTSPSTRPSTSPSTRPSTSPSTRPSTSPSTRPSTSPTVEYLYEYKKVTGATFTNWTDWSSWSKTSCATQEINCSDSSASCLKKLQLLKRKEKIGTYQKTYAKQREMVVQTGSYQKKSCSKYNYVEINKTLYATTTTKTYTQVNTITTTTRQTVGGWTYNGRGSYSNPPRDTGSTHYVFTGADYSYCADTCTTLPNYYYDKYTYTGGMTSVSSTTTPGNITSTSSSSTSTSTSTSYEASCGAYITQTVPIYGTITVTEKATRTEPLYGDVCYASTKTRSVKTPGTTTYKWSTYNDTSLLNAGWVYTGKTKVK